MNTFRQVVNPWQDSARVRALVVDERIGKMASELEGIESYFPWRDQAPIKHPWDNATTFHIDCPFHAFSSHHALTLWVALDDVTQLGHLFVRQDVLIAVERGAHGDHA